MVISFLFEELFGVAHVLVTFFLGFISFVVQNIVKVATNEELEENKLSTAISFSREVSKTIQNIYHHIGIYIYNVAYLKKFVQLRQTQNEKIQRLEQLRAIDNNIEINVILANSSPIGVDTEEDFLELKKIMNYKT